MTLINHLFESKDKFKISIIQDAVVNYLKLLFKLSELLNMISMYSAQSHHVKVCILLLGSSHHHETM